MSTLKANRYENTASSSGGIDIDSSGKLGFGTSAPKEVVDSRGAAVFSGDHATSQNAYGTAHGIMLSSTSNLASIKAVSNGSNDVAMRFIPLSSGSGSEAMRILAAGGLTFNGDTAAANALSDYEEGTFTPSISDGITGTGADGHYVKIGAQVFLYLSITWPSTSNGNSAKIEGFPFTARSTGRPGAGLVRYQTTLLQATLRGTLIPTNQDARHLL